VPVVDSLAVRVVTDSYHHAFEPGRKINDLTVQRFAFALAKGRCRTNGACRCTWNRARAMAHGRS